VLFGPGGIIFKGLWFWRLLRENITPLSCWIEGRSSKNSLYQLSEKISTRKTSLPSIQCHQNSEIFFNHWELFEKEIEKLKKSPLVRSDLEVGKYCLFRRENNKFCRAEFLEIHEQETSVFKWISKKFMKFII
jgi:hypothetical protein